MSLTLRHLYKFDAFIVDENERVLLRNGRMVPLTPKVFETLLLLVKNHGSIVTKEKMLTTLWPNVFVEESNITFNIRMLRKALGDTRQSSVYIETIPRRGYRFKTHVREVLEDDTSFEITRTEFPPHSSNGKREPAAVEREQLVELHDSQTGPYANAAVSLINRKRIVLLLAIAAVLAGTAGIWRFNRHFSANSEKLERNAMR